MASGGFAACVTRLDRFGCFGNEDDHGFVRHPSEDVHASAEGTQPLLSPEATEDAGANPSPKSGGSTSPKRRARRSSETIRDVKLEEAIAAAAQSEVVKQPLLRPPRSVKGLLLAGFCTFLGGCLGAAVGFFGLYLEPRLLMSKECHEVEKIRNMGLDAVHLYNLVLSFYCHTIRTSVILEFMAPMVFGVGGALAALRLSYGQAYFKDWTDEESMAELKKLYSQRSDGGLFVLRCWRIRVAALFGFQVIVMMWLRYTVDLAMDVQAMTIFMQHEEIAFFLLNLAGVFLGFFWTAYEFYMVISSGSKIGRAEIFFAGLTLPVLGQHVTYLAILSLFRGEVHPFLFVSTLSEAILESSFSSYIQTYAVVFTTEMTWTQKSQLYFSVFMSFVSIGYAFSTIDMLKNGRMLVKIPGFCKNFDGRFFTVFFFRVAEITSRATSLALFQAITRPYGMFVLIAADALIMASLTVLFQSQVGKYTPVGRLAFVRQNFFYVLPSVLCCRMAPMLEQDTVLTIPPWAYYAVRLLEIGAMFAVGGRWLDWDLESAQNLFEDDGLVIAGFLTSTLVMFLLAIVIRTVLSVRTLLDSPVSDIWSGAEFNNVQHALKNRILKDHDTDRDALGLIMRILETDPGMSSSACRWHAKEAGLVQPTAAWEASFLRAKVTMCIGQALAALEGFRSSRGEARALENDSLVTLRAPAVGSLTVSGSKLLGMMPNDLSLQKFVVETVRNASEANRPLFSGEPVRLRCLATGHLVGLERSAEQLELKCKSHWESEAATLMSMVLVHEDTYRSPLRFAQHVRVGSGLEVTELRQARQKGQSSKGWNGSGWTILAINGEVATRAMVDEILQGAKRSPRGSKYAKMSSTVSDGGNDLGNSRLPHEAAAAKGEYIVQFVRAADNSETPIRVGNKVMLKHATGWTSAAVSFSQSMDASKAVDGEEDKEVAAKPQLLEESVGTSFLVEASEYGSKDDPGTYQWAASQIHRLSDSVQLQTSAAEKYRTLTVVAFNARTTGVDGVAGILQSDPDLYVRVLSSLLHPIRNQKDIRVEYECLGDLLMEVVFSPDTDSDVDPVKILAWENKEDEGTIARSSGLQIGDELLEIELLDDREKEGAAKKINSPAEMRELLQEESEEPVVLTFRSRGVRGEDSSGTVKKAVSQAEDIATLLPTWKEIADSGRRSLQEGDYAELKDAILSRTFLFRAKCDMALSLMSAGLNLLYDDFIPSALELHQHFSPAPDSILFTYFPGREYAELREELVIAQLEVLTSLWRNLPRIVKEDMPETIRKLFRPDIELELMKDGVLVLMRRWESGREVNQSMPEPLVNFFAAFKPSYEETQARELSMLWITRAWHGQLIQQQRVQSLIADISRHYEAAEYFWEHKVKEALDRAEDAQRKLEEAVKKEQIRVLLCNSVSDLELVKSKLRPENLMLREDCKIGISNVPKGKCLIWSQGAVAEHFKTLTSPDFPKIHDELPKLYKGKEVRLLFSGRYFDTQHAEAQQALDSLQHYISLARPAGEAFPAVKQILHERSETLHKSQLFKKDQEAKRKLLLKEKELQETMRVAERRLIEVEREKQIIAKKNQELEEAKAEVVDELVMTQKSLKDGGKETVKELYAKKRQMEAALKEVGDFLDKQKSARGPAKAADLNRLIDLVSSATA